MSNTSVPRTTPYATPHASLLEASEYLRVSFAPEGLAALNAWPALALCTTVPRRDLHSMTADPGALESIGALLDSAKTGFRMLVAGPESDVYLARAAALDHGALDEEIALAVTSAARRRVHCAHCTTITVTNQAIGSIVECSGCDRSLLVYHHFSRRTSSYLGFLDNAENSE